MRRSNGFTLIELSVVLVIIGLLAGSILIGSTLIRQAAVRSVVTDFSKYRSAVINFRDRFDGLPGDLTNATTLWGRVASGTACFGTASTDARTCDGDGDGLIEQASNTGESGEMFRFWQHLANAGFITGSYTGVSRFRAGNWRDSTPGINVPLSKLNDAGFGVLNAWGDVNGAVFGRDMGDQPTGFVFEPGEQMSIDSKMDDGKPNTGIVRSAYTECLDNGNGSDPNANYDVSKTAILCSISFPDGFGS